MKFPEQRTTKTTRINDPRSPRSPTDPASKTDRDIKSGAPTGPTESPQILLSDRIPSLLAVFAVRRTTSPPPTKPRESFKENEFEQSTEVAIMYPVEPPVVCEFDWELDELEGINQFGSSVGTSQLQRLTSPSLATPWHRKIVQLQKCNVKPS
ncbi:hypothetical protein NL676_019927 [Syzygium grande]|nr:hypothetical protein NL676_019927 [Syzygium grande]